MSPQLPVTHPTSVIFLDETGRVGTDGVFGVGCLKILDLVEFMGEVRDARRRNSMYGELQWKNLTRSDQPTGAAPLVEELLARICEPTVAQFSARFTDGSKGAMRSKFGGDIWRGYEVMARDALLALVGPSEVVTVLADRYTPPGYLRFEKTVRTEVNDNRGRLAIANLVRMKSSSVDGLQLVDLLLGAVANDYRVRGALSGLKGGLTERVLEAHRLPAYRWNDRVRSDWYDIRWIGTHRGKRAGAKNP